MFKILKEKILYKKKLKSLKKYIIELEKNKNIILSQIKNNEIPLLFLTNDNEYIKKKYEIAIINRLLFEIKINFFNLEKEEIFCDLWKIYNYILADTRFNQKFKTVQKKYLLKKSKENYKYKKYLKYLENKTALHFFNRINIIVNEIINGDCYQNKYPKQNDIYFSNIETKLEKNSFKNMKIITSIYDLDKKSINQNMEDFAKLLIFYLNENYKFLKYPKENKIIKFTIDTNIITKIDKETPVVQSLLKNNKIYNNLFKTIPIDTTSDDIKRLMLYHKILEQIITTKKLVNNQNFGNNQIDNTKEIIDLLTEYKKLLLTGLENKINNLRP